MLLTPYDLLREDEPAINRKDFMDSYDSIRMTIENESLRVYVNNYLNIFKFGAYKILYSKVLELDIDESELRNALKCWW